MQNTPAHDGAPQALPRVPQNMREAELGHQLEHLLKSLSKPAAGLLCCGLHTSPCPVQGRAQHRPLCPAAQGQPGHPADTTASSKLCPAQPAGLQQSCTYPQVTHTSNKRQLQLHRAGGSTGCQPARGRRLLVSPTATNKPWMNGGPLGTRMHICSPPCREGQLAADLSRTANLNFFNPTLL